jgi:LmbE family N-acetylglucosaminyl deacetylase
MGAASDVFDRARDLFGRATARALSRRSARYHDYHSNPLDEDQAYSFGSALEERVSPLAPQMSVPGGGAVLLGLRLTTKGLGYVRDPYVELCGQDGSTVRQYVERGVAGLRYINVTALAGHDGVTLSLSDLTLLEPTAHWVVSPHPMHEGPLLIVAPHPDDAELSSFGLYADADTWVVTVCAGEVGTHDYGGLFSADEAGALLRGRLRVAESLSAPVAGGVPKERIANLGYFDGSLTGMCFERDRPARSAGTGSRDLGLFRAAGDAALLPPRSDATWDGLVADLVHLLEHTKAATVTFPHPVLDHHSDHACLGLAVLEAVRRANHKPECLLAYAVHGPGGGKGASIHPVGPRGGSVGLPPGKHPTPLFDGLYSVPLSPALLRRKALALDTYRDLKDEEGPLPVEAVGTRVKRGLREVYRAFVVYDLGLVRRFLRPNELFYVLDPHRLAHWEHAFAAHVRARFEGPHTGGSALIPELT